MEVKTMAISKYWAITYGREGKREFICPECGKRGGAVAGDTHIGTRYDNGKWDSQGWRVLKCGHGISVYDYADGTRQIAPAPSLVS
jgi:hypothetical protein